MGEVFPAAGVGKFGVDKADFGFPGGFPGQFIKCSVYELDIHFIDSFDAITSSPPCEEFARAWLPWLRGDHKPAQWAVDLLEWSVKLCHGKPNRITECSRFSTRHVPGGLKLESYALWGDIPLLMPQLTRSKMKTSGLRPDIRAETPAVLADWIADNYTRNLIAAA